MPLANPGRDGWSATPSVHVDVCVADQPVEAPFEGCRTRALNDHVPGESATKDALDRVDPFVQSTQWRSRGP